MQLVHCTVNLAGDPRYQTKRNHVSVPEILVLKAVHGDDAVVDIVYAGERSADGEYERLMNFYGKKEEIKEKIEKMFPGGQYATLPKNLDQINLAEVATPEIVEAFNAAEAERKAAEKAAEKAVKAVRTRREIALAEADEAQDEEAELIRPPVKKTSTARTRQDANVLA